MPTTYNEKREFDPEGKQQPTLQKNKDNLILIMKNRDAANITEKKLCSEKVLIRLINLIKDQEIREKVLSKISYNNQEITEEQVDKLEKLYTNSKILNFCHNFQDRYNGFIPVLLETKKDIKEIESFIDTVSQVDIPYYNRRNFKEDKAKYFKKYTIFYAFARKNVFSEKDFLRCIENKIPVDFTNCLEHPLTEEDKLFLLELQKYPDLTKQYQSLFLYGYQNGYIQNPENYRKLRKQKGKKLEDYLVDLYGRKTN